MIHSAVIKSNILCTDIFGKKLLQTTHSPTSRLCFVKKFFTIINIIQPKERENYNMDNKTEKLHFHMKPIPEYYDGMYLDGYTNEEILQAARNKITRMDEERRAEELLQ